MRRSRLLVAAASLALICSGCNFSLQALPKFSSQTGPFYKIHATFANVLNLPADAQVRTGVATIGQVSSITTNNFKANLTLEIRTNIKLPVGTTGQVRFDSPLGDEYVVLVPPTNRPKGPYLTNGANLSERDTSSAPSIEDALAALSTLLNGGGLDQLHTITTNLNDTFNGNQSQLRDLITQITNAVSSLSDHKSDIDNALTSIGALSQALNQGVPVITTGLDTITPAINVLASENGDINQLLTSVTNLANVANNILDQSGSQLVGDVNQLLPVVNQLVSVDQQLGPDLSDIANFEQLTPKIAPGDYLQVSLNANAQFPSASAATTAQTTGGNQKQILDLLSQGLP